MINFIRCTAFCHTFAVQTHGEPVLKHGKYGYNDKIGDRR